MKRFKKIKSIVILAGALNLAACGGGGDDSDYSVSNAVNNNQTSSNSCNYSDLISSETRRDAAKDGPQCGAQVANADSQLDLAKSYCKRGDTTTADKVYSQYKQIATYATQAVKLVCGGTSTSLPSGVTTNNPAEPVAKYTLYILYRDSFGGQKVIQSGVCSTTPVSRPANDSTVYYQAVRSNLSLSECKLAGKPYGLTFN